MDVFGKMFGMFYKIKVLHSIPGRLRISVPAIKNIPSEWQIKEEDINNIFLELPGAKSISFTYLTGSGVVQYDTSVTNEKNVLFGIDKIVKIVINHRKEFENISASELKKEVKRMTEIIKKELKR